LVGGYGSTKAPRAFLKKPHISIENLDFQTAVKKTPTYAYPCADTNICLPAHPLIKYVLI